MSLILDGTNGLSDVDGTAATPAIRGTDANTGIFFPAADTIAFSEGGAESMRIDSSGNLGIGTTNPTSLLHLRSTNPTIQMVDSDNNGTAYIQASNGNLQFYADDSNVVASSLISFATDGTERVRINSVGDVFIGSTGPMQIEQLGVNYNSGVRTGINTNNTAGGGSTAMAFFTSGLPYGSITTSTAGTAFNTSSDYRLKENIAPIIGALAKIQALKPVTYTWKTDGSNGEGFIAHELAEVCPQAVHGEKDAIDAEGKPIHQGIDTSFLVATLTKAIQELNAKVEAQALEIEALKAK
jgi:hypothetical protein